MIKQLVLSFTIIILFTACKKDKIEEIKTSNFENGILCMNEGLFQQNNASLSYYSIDSNTVNTNVFSGVNGRGLGDTANDMITYFYNGAPYIAIAVDVSSQIEIIDAITLKSVKQIPIFNGNSAREPRSLQQNNNFLYSVNYDGTVSVINLATYTIIDEINVGLNPDNSIIKNDLLYIVNSGGLNPPDYDNTITIIDLNSNLVVNSIITDINCGSIVKDDQKEIYLTSRGDYNDINSKLLRINVNNEIQSTFDLNIGPMTYFGDYIYYLDYNDNGIHKLNTVNESISNNVLIDCSQFETVYSIQINPKNSLIYITDANNYVNSSIVRCYDINGNFKYEFTSGLNTGKLIFR